MLEDVSCADSLRSDARLEHTGGPIREIVELPPRLLPNTIIVAPQGTPRQLWRQPWRRPTPLLYLRVPAQLNPRGEEQEKTNFNTTLNSIEW